VRILKPKLHLVEYNNRFLGQATHWLKSKNWQTIHCQVNGLFFIGKMVDPSTRVTINNVGNFGDIKNYWDVRARKQFGTHVFTDRVFLEVDSLSIYTDGKDIKVSHPRPLSTLYPTVRLELTQEEINRKSGDISATSRDKLEAEGKANFQHWTSVDKKVGGKPKLHAGYYWLTVGLLFKKNRRRIELHKERFDGFYLKAGDRYFANNHQYGRPCRVGQVFELTDNNMMETIDTWLKNDPDPQWFYVCAGAKLVVSDGFSEIEYVGNIVG
jgi:hypothetical protein